MSVLSWGKPTIEIATSTAGVAGNTWEVVPTAKEDTALLTPTKGDIVEAKEEGGRVVDSRRKANSYVFEWEHFVKKGEDPPIEDEDGIVIGDMALRLTPEDDTLKGILIESASVSVEERWSSAEGRVIKYTFDVKKPATGKMVKPYTKPVTP